MEKIWIEFLPKELDEIKEFIDPPMEVESDDIVVGDATDEMKRLYTLSCKYEEIFTRMAVEARYAKNENEQIKARKKMTEANQKRETLLEIFWICIKDYFELWGKNSVGIRKGYKIIWRSRKKIGPKALLEFLEDI